MLSTKHHELRANPTHPIYLISILAVPSPLDCRSPNPLSASLSRTSWAWSHCTTSIVASQSLDSLWISHPTEAACSSIPRICVPDRSEREVERGIRETDVFFALSLRRASVQSEPLLISIQPIASPNNLRQTRNQSASL